MRIQAEPTPVIANIDGVCCRIWNAVTDRGTPCLLFIHRLAAHPGATPADRLALEVELEEQGAPASVVSMESMPRGVDNPPGKGGRNATSTKGQARP